MADSHSPTNPNPTQAQTPAAAPTPSHSQHPGHQYEGSDPDLPASAEGSTKRVNVSTVQVGASAAAAVTSALAASFFGVAGTLIGAAVGSIVSTIAGALYADYMRRAGRRLRDTKSVVIQRIPSEVLATTPLRHLTGPTDLPGEPSMRAIGDENEQESVSLPLSSPTELLAETGDATKTMTMPAYGTAAAEAIYASSQANSSTQSSPAVNGSTRGMAVPAAPARAWYKRPVVTLPAIGLAGFGIALGVVTAAEGVNGGPISGGSGGTSLSKAFKPDHKAKATPTPTVTPTGTPTASTPSPTSTAVKPVAPASPTASSQPQDTATAAPTTSDSGTGTGTGTDGGVTQATPTN